MEENDSGIEDLTEFAVDQEKAKAVWDKLDALPEPKRFYIFHPAVKMFGTYNLDDDIIPDLHFSFNAVRPDADFDDLGEMGINVFLIKRSDDSFSVVDLAINEDQTPQTLEEINALLSRIIEGRLVDESQTPEVGRDTIQEFKDMVREMFDQ